MSVTGETFSIDLDALIRICQAAAGEDSDGFERELRDFGIPAALRGYVMHRVGEVQRPEDDLDEDIHFDCHSEDELDEAGDEGFNEGLEEGKLAVLGLLPADLADEIKAKLEEGGQAE